MWRRVEVQEAWLECHSNLPDLLLSQLSIHRGGVSRVGQMGEKVRSLSLSLSLSLSCADNFMVCIMKEELWNLKIRHEKDESYTSSLFIDLTITLFFLSFFLFFLLLFLSLFLFLLLLYLSLFLSFLLLFPTLPPRIVCKRSCISFPTALINSRGEEVEIFFFFSNEGPQGIYCTCIAGYITGDRKEYCEKGLRSCWSIFFLRVE